jgi:hypothetical protein
MFSSLFARLRDLRARTGRPHWLIVDEAHHVMPGHWAATEHTLPQHLAGVLMVSVTPSLIAPAALRSIDTLLVLGDKPVEMLAEFARANDVSAPHAPCTTVPEGSALLWSKSDRSPPRLVNLEPTRTERRRHLRKYAEGSLPAERSFFFRGPEGKLNLRAYNLILFMDLADGVDDETWLHHLRNGDVSAWLRAAIKDPVLADRIAECERTEMDATSSRRRVRELIEQTYTLPAGE